MVKYFLTSMALLATLATSPAFSQEVKMDRMMSLTGHGVVHVVPDMAMINVGVVSSAESARVALDANTKAMTKLMADLKAAQIDEKDIATSNFSVNPRFDYGQSGGQPPKLVGYDVSNTVTVTVRKIDGLGALLDKAVSSGSNQINGISFSVSKPEAAMDQARILAVADAKHKAQVLSDASGIVLGKIVAITENTATAEPPMMYGRAKAMAADAAPVPIAQGTQVISVDVNINWEIK
ncbi:MAG: SIMPL domain-containing protein [Alphaproteobacteria bacterium]|nr:SIMPL domain-containing protein [Alphaproteobacteria bacterium]